MNVFCPQSIEAQIELEEIADLKLQIITPQSSSPIIAMKQDQLLGTWNLTKEYYKLDWRTVMNFLSGLELDEFNNIPRKEYTGKEVYSYLIPKKINLLKGDPANPKILVKNGILEAGLLGEDALGVKKKNSLVQLVWDEYGVSVTKKFLDNTTKLANCVNMYHGMTVGIGDLFISDSMYHEMTQLYASKKLEIQHEITELENNPEMMDEKLFETSVNSKLAVIRDDASKLIIANTPGTNNIITMMDSGAKGKAINLAQMVGCVGQQDFHGGRMKKNYNERSLPYFFKNDDRAESRGFIEKPFMRGLNLTDFIFHHTTAREGLIDQTVRTAESGYIQRKLIKATEDMMVNYDGTVRNAVGRILQFQYGDSGADTVKQYEYNFKLMEMGNEEIRTKYSMTKEELNKIKGWSESDNKDFIKLITKIRDNLRKTQVKTTLNYLTLSISYMLPVNLYRIIDNFRNDETLKGTVCNEPNYIMDMIHEILEPYNTRLYCLTSIEMKNKKSVKYCDDQVAKTVFGYALTDILAPLKCIFQYKLSKEQLEGIKKEIIKSFNKSIVEPGEMVGIVAAQSLGEPVTQLMLNSLDWEQEIMIHNKENKVDLILPIGKFIDELIELNKDQVTNPLDNPETEMGNIFYLDTLDMDHYIKSVDEDGKVSWKHIEAVTKHLPINKDGTDTLIKVTTKTGKTVIATKGKSLLTQSNNKIVPIRGDEIKVGDYLPIMKRCMRIDNNSYEFFEESPNNVLNLGDVFMDEIMSIEEVKPTHTYVYDFTVADTKNFVIANGLCVRDSFHASGVGGKGGTNIGVDRIKEVFSLSKNPKAPEMQIYLDTEHRTKKDFANKVASHIKFTTIMDLRNKIEILYDPNPYVADGFIARDNIGVPFYTYQSNKQCCTNSIDGLPWLMRIEFDREKLLTKEVSLLDIKSQFCFAWEKRYTDVKGIKREKRQVIDKITQLAVLSNTDNDNTPILHIRFDMTNFTQSTLVDFMDLFVDEFKLKGMSGIEDIVGGGKAFEERIISFDNKDNIMEKNSEYVIYTRGINMDAIKNIVGVDLNRTYCNDIINIFENFGIEAARNFIIRQIITVLTSNGSGTNYQHIEIFGDLMAHIGTLTSIDRHGLNKLDTDPLSRASFEKTVDQLITAAIFNEVDYMKSVSSRIMAGLCIKGGTGLCNLILDKDLLENSEYTTDVGQLYNKTYKDITSTLQTQEIDEDVFIPEM